MSSENAIHELPLLFGFWYFIKHCILKKKSNFEYFDEITNIYN